MMSPRSQLLSGFSVSASKHIGALREVQFSYNDFAQSVRKYQAHAGAVNTTTTPSVQRGYADGSGNTIRPVGLTYPNGRTIGYDYGVSTSLNNQISRIASILDDAGPFGAPHLVDYSYLGLGAVVKQDSPEANLQYTLIDSGSSDIYGGLDRFGRVQNLRWLNTSSNDVLSQVQYGYDRASNRTWRQNPIATANSAQYDWLYSYDGLQRLKTGGRGVLNTQASGLTTNGTRLGPKSFSGLG